MVLESNVLRIQVWIRDLLLVKTERERELAIQKIKVAQDDFLSQLEQLRDIYIGAQSDLDEVRKAAIGFQASVDDLTKSIMLGKVADISNNILNTGNIGETRKQLMTRLGVIDSLSKAKSDEIYATSEKAYQKLKNQQLILISTIVLITLMIYFLIIRALIRPLIEITNVALDFHDGNMQARSKYISNNELGILSKTFNILAISIQKQRLLEKKISGLFSSLLSEYGEENFFPAMLKGLQEYTDSQMIAIYLLNEDKHSYSLYKSIGLGEQAKTNFSADALEGEIGNAIASKNIQYIKNNEDPNPFVFTAVCGEIVAREIITIPITASGEVIAVISMAKISSYDEATLPFLNTIYVTLCARIEGVLSYFRLRDFSDRLEMQNRELETQKLKLAAQSAELAEQNFELEAQKSQLSEASKLKSNFLSNMSHELRTPLNSVIALSGVLNRKLMNRIEDEEYSYLEVIERNGKHLLSLINDILDISRIESGKTEMNITRFNAREEVLEIMELIQPQAEQKGLTLQMGTAVADSIIQSDSFKFKHIIQNLIGNAVKFTESGHVTIDLLCDDKHLTIKVKDTGIGISNSHLVHIFDEFRQADSGTTRRFGGSGLGLSIAKKYSELLGGSISVSSKVGEGSEFILTMPLLYSQSTVENEVEPEFISRSLEPKMTNLRGERRCRILLVDDSEPAIIQMKYFLKEEGYEILIARDGNEALEIIAQTIPDAMILDLMMPRVDGFQVLATIRGESKTAHIPVLILTARHISKEELQFLKRNNIHQLIQKGDVGKEELLRAITNMIDLRCEARKEPSITKTILIVEDNQDNMLTAKALLKDKYLLVDASDGAEAIDKARIHVPDLILMDIGLPGIDGIEAFQIIRNDPRLHHIPIVALTASALISDKDSILAMGFNAYFPKPIEEQRFWRLIEELLNGN